ncbi:MAG TPA: hypothetical protein VGR22_11065 [Thermomicrobiales bacterium]|nr:hypothetical protein [Thermomicrobiales bacterium]
MPTPERLEHSDSRSYLHRSLQRRVALIVAGLALVLVIALIPVITNAELRLEIFRTLGWVPGAEGELVAPADSGATMIVLPIVLELESTALPKRRFLAAYITRPTGDGMWLAPINDGEPFTVPLDDYDLVSSSPDGTEMYVRGEERAVLVDVTEHRVVEMLPAGEVPDVAWDWQTATWETGVGRCDLVSNTLTWIGCFERPVLATYLAGDWHLSILRYGGSEEEHDVVRGLGFRPLLGFSADDEWIYLYNENGIRRFSVDEAVED